MKIIIIASNKDTAGMNIVENLKKLDCKMPIFIEDEEIVNLENIDKKFDCDFIIFVSKHQSVKRVKTLTVHPIGNWKNAELGGKDKTVCLASGRILKKFFILLNENSQNIDDFIVSMEVTHHGPYIEKPSLFIEIGSSEEDWKNQEAGEIIAKTICDFSFNDLGKYPVGIGIGGPHYSPNFNEIQNKSSIAISHIIPEYVLPLDENMLDQAINKTTEKVDYILVDWKGLGNSDSRNFNMGIIEKFAKENNIEILKTKKAKLI